MGTNKKIIYCLFFILLLSNYCHAQNDSIRRFYVSTDILKPLYSALNEKTLFLDGNVMIPLDRTLHFSCGYGYGKQFVKEPVPNTNFFYKGQYFKFGFYFDHNDIFFLGIEGYKYLYKGEYQYFFRGTYWGDLKGKSEKQNFERFDIELVSGAKLEVYDNFYIFLALSLGFRASQSFGDYLWTHYYPHLGSPLGFCYFRSRLVVMYNFFSHPSKNL